MDNLDIFCIMGIILYIVAFIVSIYMIVYFFRLCSDVKIIKSRIFYEEFWFDEVFLMYVSTGDIDKAKNMLYGKVKADPYFAEAFSSPDKNYTQGARDKIAQQYGRYFAALDIDIDFSKVDSFYIKK